MGNSNTTHTKAPKRTTQPVMVWPEVVAEGTRFLTQRLQQDMETQRAMLTCKTPAEVLQVQTTYFTTAMEHYSAYATRLYAGMQASAQDALRQASTPHTSRYDDVPL